VTPSAPTPPRWASAIVRRLSLFEGLFAVSDDFESEYARRLGTEGRRRARLWAGTCALRAALSYVPTAVRWSLIMHAHQLKIAWRNLRRHKGYSFINVAGLALGVAAGLFVLVYVGDELSYDRFHAKAGRTYRIAQNLHVDDRVDTAVSGPAVLAPTLKREFPEVEAVARLRSAGDGFVVRDGARVIGKPVIHAADPGFFEVFSFPLVSGDPRTALAEPGSIVLTRSAAATCFGTADPMGRVLTIGDEPFKVTGLMENVPRRSHVHFEYLTSDISYPQGRKTTWKEGFCATYLVLKEGADRKAFEAKLPGFALAHIFDGRKPESGIFKDWVFFLQPLTSIHLRSHLRIGELESNGHFETVILFLAIAVSVLLIAAVNFINLSTARSSVRAREVAVRKVVGSERSRLVRQFLGESVFQSALAVALAAGIMAAAMPAFRSLSGKEIFVRSLVGWPALLLCAGFALVLGLGAGFYPALVLSSFRPAAVLKGGGSGGAGLRSATLRKILTVTQFSMSVFLLIGTAVVSRQMDYVRTKRLGFDREHVIVVHDASLLGRQSSAFKEALLRNPGIQAVAASTGLPGRGINWTGCNPEGSRENMLVGNIGSDPDLPAAIRLDMAAGRFISAAFPSDDRAIVVNEEMVRQLGWTEPIGKRIRQENKDFTVIGVVRDFHPGSLHEPIPRMTLRLLNPNSVPRFLAVRIGPGDVRPVLSSIKSAWDSFSPPLPLNYTFLDDDYGQLYKTEMQTGRVVGLFSGLAVAIACLGLFGLAAFMADRRKREVGIRKVLGARAGEIVGLLTRDFLLWVLVANVLAWPAAFIVTQGWLRRFAYRVDLDLRPFLVALALTLATAAAAIGLQTVRAALARPADTIRNE
jgi:putative ABC transport system permease protein